MSTPPTLPAFRPLYDQIRALLIQSLESGEWKPGEAIPPEPDLAARFGVSQGTVRKAIDALAADNLLLRRQGKGTFVASHAGPDHRHRFLRIVPDEGPKVAPVSTLIDLVRDKVSGPVARALQLRPGSSVIRFRRLLAFAGRPLVLDEMVLPATQFPRLTLERLAEHTGSIYAFYEEAYGVRMIRAEERLRSVAAEAEPARRLGVEPGSPLLCVDRTAYTYGNVPVEWRRGLCLTDGYGYFNELA